MPLKRLDPTVARTEVSVMMTCMIRIVGTEYNCYGETSFSLCTADWINFACCGTFVYPSLLNNKNIVIVKNRRT